MSDHTIGQVVSMLTPEFPDVTISKLRFLEDKGLVTPIRTPAGYRKYTQDDVVRLRYVLSAQRDRYLPLKVIREHLDAMTAEAADTDESTVDAPIPPPVAVAGPASGREPDRTLAELAEHLDVEIAHMRSLRDDGIIREEGPYDDAEQRIAKWAVVLIRDGLESRHLRMFLQFADREVALVEQLITPLLRQRNPDANRRARLLAGDLGEAAARLHGAILSRSLEKLLRACLPPRTSAWSMLLAGAMGLALVSAPTVPAAATSAAAVAEISVAADGLWSPDAAGWPSPGVLDAPSWILVDVTTGQILAAQEATARRPPASTTKLLTALAVSRRIDGASVATISAAAASTIGASSGLVEGAEVRVDDLLALLLLRSGNDAAVALAEHTAGSQEAFAELLRQEAEVLGLERFVLSEPHGLEDRNLLSARQLAVVGRAVLADPILRPLVGASMWTLSTGQVIRNRNHLLGVYPGATGLKTGMTTAAGWSLVASARRGPVHLVAVILGGTDDASRFADAARLLDFGFDEMAPAPANPTLRLRGEGEWIALRAPARALRLPLDSSVDFDPRLPVELADPAVRWSWTLDGVDGWLRQPALAGPVPGAPTVGSVGWAPPSEQVDGDDTAALGAWLSGRVQAALRAATVAGLWDD